MKRIKLLPFIVLFILISVGIFFLATNVKKTSQQDNEQILQSVNEKKLEEIRSREGIKRQQELIVQETFLIEEKDRIKNEKEEAIKQFDAQTEDIEKQLEAVREEQITF